MFEAMEGDKAETGGGSVGGPASSRWNPTKEQINILENMYKQGVRTPSAEQIQQITNRLKVYGHIEGKNVFYWFQNHKARQRQKQKQKQEGLAYFNRFVYRSPPPPVFAPPYACPNVVCSPYYIHQNDVGFYPQCHNSQTIKAIDVEICDNTKETLSLFPTHPTGDLQVRPAETASPAFGSDDSSSFGRSGIEGSLYCQNYFDFFCKQGS